MFGDKLIDREQERPLASSQRMLWIGFGIILLLMALIGVDVAQSLKTSNEKNAELIKSFRNRDEIFEDLRDIMTRSGVMIRDYLSATDEAKIANEKATLLAANQQTEQLLAAYESHEEGEPREKKTFGDLRMGVRSYWKSLSSALQWDLATKKKKGDAYRRDAIGPLRTEVLRLSRNITELNHQQLDAGEQLIQMEQTKLRTRLVVASALGVSFACALAIVVTVRIRRAEQSAERQYRTIARARRELRELTARLESAQEEERKNLSRELHDEVGQSMSSMLVELSRLEAVLPQDPSVRQRLASFRKQAESSVRSVRDMALLLRPSMLDDLGLVAALKWQGREVARRTGLRIHIDAEDTSDQLPDSHRTCIYRIVQEALNNCARHAKASSVVVILKQSPGSLDVSVRDDGSGFEPSTEKGLGLLGMEERVKRLGGAILVESARGRGTALNVRLPVPALEKVS